MYNCIYTSLYAKEFCYRSCFNEDLILEMDASKSTIFIETFHIRPLTLVKELDPTGAKL